MKSKTLFIYLLFGCPLWSICPGCVSTYQPIILDNIPIDDYWNKISVADVEIALDYDVLTAPGDKQYAKMEMKNKVSLVILSIHNAGQQELNLARDLVFQTSDGYSILPYMLAAGMEKLVKPVTDEESTDVVEVDAPSSWDLIWGVGKTVNETKTVVSHVRFANDLMEHYLEDRILTPGQYMKGFLILPVQKHTPIEISLRQEF